MSATTTKHVGIAKKYAEKVIAPPKPLSKK